MAAALALSAGICIAQESSSQGEKPGKGSTSKPPVQAPQGSAASLKVPHPNQLLILIRSTLLAANQANLTGNYSVLRDLGTPDFQQTNSAARLAEIFRDLRSRNIDIDPIAVLDAKLVQQPSIDPNGRLRLSGYFPSRPEQVNFDLAFQMMGGRWRLYGIALNTTRNEQPVAATGAKGQPQPPAPAGKPKSKEAPAAASSSRP